MNINKSSLRVFSTAVTATGSATTTGSFQTLQNRGDAVAIGVVASSNTVADVDGVTFTIKANGDEVFKNAPAIKFSPLFNQEKDREEIFIPENTTLDYSITNDQANAIVFYINVYYNK